MRIGLRRGLLSSARGWAVPAALAAVVAFGLWLRADSFRVPVITGDEIGDLILAQGSVADAVRGAARGGPNPPLSFVVSNLASRAARRASPAGWAEWVRVPSIAWGTASLLAVFWLGRILFGSAEGIGGAFALALLPGHLIWSRNSRMYALYILLCLLSCTFFFLALTRSRKRDLPLYVMCTAAAVYTHYFAAAMIATQWAYLLLLAALPRDGDPGAPSFTPRTALRFLAATAVVGVLFLPWLPVFLAQIRRGTTPYGMTLSISSLREYVRTVAGLDYHRGHLPHYLALAAAAAGVCVDPERRPRQVLFLLLWIILPAAPVWIASVAVECILPRNVVFVLPAVSLLLSCGFLGLSRALERLCGGRLHRAAFAGMLFLSYLACVAPFHPRDRRGQPDWRALADHLERSVRPGDGVEAFHSDHWQHLWFYWNEKPRGIAFPAPPLYRDKWSLRYMDGDPAVDNPRLAARFLEPGRLWVVQFGAGFDPEEDRWLDRHAPIVARFGGPLVMRCKNEEVKPTSPGIRGFFRWLTFTSHPPPGPDRRAPRP